MGLRSFTSTLETGYVENSTLTLTMSPSPFTRTVESRHDAKQQEVKVVVMEELKKELKIEVKEVRKRGADILSG